MFQIRYRRSLQLVRRCSRLKPRAQRTGLTVRPEALKADRNVDLFVLVTSAVRDGKSATLHAAVNCPAAAQKDTKASRLRP